MPSFPFGRRLPLPAFSSLAALLLGAFAMGCVPQIDSNTEGGDEAQLAQVPNRVMVNGKSYDVETEYLPRVVMCENGGASQEALRAQAIAARTFLTFKYRVEGRTSIRDGQEDQVFTCASNKNGVSDEVRAAVADTKGKIVMRGSTITAGFFVAGARRTTGCVATTDPTNTERFVTINAGKTGSAVKPSSIGDASNPANRGAMGQNLANCIALRNHYSAAQILAHFYGADITISNEGAPPPSDLPTDDPALAPLPDTTTTGPTQPSGDVIEPQPTGPTCWSFMLQNNVPVGTCVQYAGDAQWYQCAASGVFEGGVVDGSGPAGTCVQEYPLPTP